MGHARSLWFVAPGLVEVRDAELPALEDGQVLVRTRFSGISAGTELLAYRGELDPDLPVDEMLGALGGTFCYPFRYGYSCVGVVEQSRSTLPEGALVFAFHPHQDSFVVDADNVLALGPLPARDATLLPLVETAFQITLDGGPVLGDVVVVYGLGVVGALTALLLRRAGAHVIAVEPRQWRRDAVAGLDIVAVEPEDVRAALGSGRSGVPLIIEASGNPEALRTALGLLAHEGTVLVASWYGRREVRLPLGGDFHRRRLTIRSTQVSTIPARLGDRWDRSRRRRAAVELMGQLPLERFATHTFPFEEATRAYEALDDGAQGVIHAALGYA